jgi:hypothetical protein
MGTFLLSVLLPLLVVALAPCWGTGTHITLTREILARYRRRRGLNAHQALVVHHPQAFFYGNIAADIINFKAYGGFRNHCHNWNIQERLEREADDDAARAFVLGYLCHLAADIVAHNHFVPYHLVYNFPPRILGHAYWEALADGRIHEEEWHAVDGFKRSQILHRFDHMVHRAVKRKALSLRSNKWIFNNILLINSRRSWREIIRNVQAGARKHPLDERFYQRCRAASLGLMLAVFYPRRLALLKIHDPRGKEALLGALRLRRELLRDFGTRGEAREVAVALAHAAYSRLPVTSPRSGR